MNIVAPTATSLPESGRNDAAPTATTATAPTPGADAGPGDPAVASGTDVQNFGQILSDSLAKGRTTAQASADPSLAAAAAAIQRAAAGASESTDKRIASDLPGVAAIGATNGAAPGKAVDPTKSAKPGDSDDPTADPVSTDLSSQLALVAQWAGVQPVPVTTGAPVSRATGDATSTKGDDVRAATAASTAASTAARAVALDVGQVQAAAMPGALEAAAFALSHDARATGSSTVGAVTAAKADPSKGTDTTTLTTSEIRTEAVDKLFALAGGTHTATAADPSSLTSQFVAQISAQVSNAQNTLGAVPTTAAASAALQEPVGSGAWSHELGQTALRMATNDLQNASLRLNPEHLGPLDVQMRIDNGVAHMQFTAAHAETRQALESSRSTLDQMFSDQGIKLGDWSVGNSSQQGAFARNAAGSAQGDGAATGDGDAVADDAVPMTVTTRPLGLVDTFA